MNAPGEQSGLQRYWRDTYEEWASQNRSMAAKSGYTEAAFIHRYKFMAHLVQDSLGPLAAAGSTNLTCLDVGCNAGTFTGLLSRHAPRVCGADFSHGMLVEARQMNPRTQFVQADAFHLPFAAGRFDYVLVAGLLCCVTDWPQVVVEVLRVLRPGGTGVIEVNRSHSFFECLVRAGARLLKRQLSWAAAADFCRSHASRFQAARGLDNRPRKHSTGALTAVLRDRGIHQIRVHDTVRQGFLHDFMLGIQFVKPDALAPSNGSVRPLHCKCCRRAGWDR